MRERVENTFGADYELDKENPGAYPIFEDVVMPALLESLNSDNKQGWMTGLFTFLEEMAASTDGNVTDLLRIAILEQLAERPENYQKALQYMGEKTRHFAALEECTQEGCE